VQMAREVRILSAAPKEGGAAERPSRSTRKAVNTPISSLAYPLRRELLVELPLPTLLHEAPDDKEAGRAGVVHEANVYSGSGRRPQDLFDL
jgi:hypothetical protein